MACMDRFGENSLSGSRATKARYARGSVLVALLLHVQVAQARIQQRRIGRAAAGSRTRPAARRRPWYENVMLMTRSVSSTSLAVGARQRIELAEAAALRRSSSFWSSNCAKTGRLSSFRPCLNSDQPCL